MNNKGLLIILTLLIVVVVLITIENRLNKIELAIYSQSRPFQQINNNYLSNSNTVVKIEKVEGNGNAFGENNIIENKSI